MALKFIISFAFIFLIGNTFGNSIQNLDLPCQFDGICNSDHLMCFGATSTINGTCKCKEIYYREGDTCKAYANGLCPTGVGCTQDSTCIAGRCQCNNGFSISHLNAQGTPRAPVCHMNRNGICRGENPITFHTCNNDQGLTCNIVGNTGTCQCKANTIWSNERQKCVGLIDSPCEKGDDCLENGFCPAHGRCTCIENHTYSHIHNMCLPSHMQQCRNLTPRCADKLTCDSSTRCVCEGGKTFQTNACRHQVGETCIADTECVQNAICGPGNRCKCKSLGEGFIETPTKTCESFEQWTASHGGICLDDRECSFSKFAYCFMETNGRYGRCACKEEYQFDMSDNGNEICAAVANATCKENQECVKNSHCIDDVCRCKPDRILVNGVCEWNLPVTAPCNSVDLHCNAQVGLMCRDNSCNCPIGQDWVAAKNHCIVQVSGQCTIEEDYCTENAYCNHLGYCSCNEGFSATENRYCKISHGQNCNVTNSIDPCNNEKFLVCSNEICSCRYPDEQIFHSASGECRSIAGGYCGALDENKPFNMSCIDNHNCKPNLLGRYTCVNSVSMVTGSFVTLLSLLIFFACL